MAIVRLATEGDIPRILKLYGQLTITTSTTERQRIPSPEDYRETFTRISQLPGHELLVAEEKSKVIDTMVSWSYPICLITPCPGR